MPDSFLITYNTFAIWGFLFLVLGTLTTGVWAMSFRRMTRIRIRPQELRFEAWRGILGGAVWLVGLALVLLLMTASGDINSAELLAICDEISPRLMESIQAERRLVVLPALGSFGLVVGVLAMAGQWSGAWAALRPREDRHE